MSYKTRGNYKGMCMKFDCKNRNIVCDKCVNMDKYIKKVKYSKKKGLDTKS